MSQQYLPNQWIASTAPDTRRVALLAGESRGIDASTALVLVQHRYNVALTYRNKESFYPPVSVQTR